MKDRGFMFIARDVYPWKTQYPAGVCESVTSLTIERSYPAGVCESVASLTIVREPLILGECWILAKNSISKDKI